MVLQHFSGYIASLSMRKLYDERGNVYYGVDEDIRERLKARLMRLSSLFGLNNLCDIGALLPLFRSIPHDRPLLFDKESDAIERRRSIRQIGYIPFVPSHTAGTP